jgi:capping protein alpha
MARVSNLKNSKVVDAPSGNKVLITAASEVDATHYVDSSNNTVFAIDHLTLETREDSMESNQDASKELARSALHSSVAKYVADTFLSDTSAGGVFCKDGNFTINICGEKVNLKNFWSGHWVSTWQVAVSGSSATVTGDVKVHVHYFEDGNLQLQTHKKIEATTFSFQSDRELSDAVVKHIQTQETVLQNGLEEMYNNMNNETFRAMRRVMPITRTKMDWNVNAVRMVKQVRK